MHDAAQSLIVRFLGSEFMVCCSMEEIVYLGETSQHPSALSPIDLDGEFEADCVEEQATLPLPTPGRRTGARAVGASSTPRSSCTPAESQAAPAHKVRGPNWIEAEMLVLIAQKRTEWDGHHNCNQPSLAKFVYGSTAWKLVLAGCMSVIGFRARDTDQITNKWDGLIKDFKRLKEYIDGTGSANWWGLSREEKKQLSRTRKMSLEFSESMYVEMEGFVGKRQIFGRAIDVVDSDRVPAPVVRNFGRTPPATRSRSAGGMGSPAASGTAASESPTGGAPGDDTPGSTGRKRKAVGIENLVDFVKNFNFEYLARVESQDKEKRAWRSEMMALDTAREARIARKDSEVVSMDQKLYLLEVERTKNLGNMTSALLMLASSMDALTRSSFLPYYIQLCMLFNFFDFSDVFQRVPHFECEPSNPKCLPLPFGLQAKLSPRSQGQLALVDGTCCRFLFVWVRSHPLPVGDSLSIFGLTSYPC